MSGRGSRVGAARLLCAAAAAAFALPAQAQTAAPPAPTSPVQDPAELDPSAPLDPLPDLGVAWPELNAKETAAPPPAANPAVGTKKKEATTAVADAAGNIRYIVAVEGLASVGAAEELLHSFRQQSALEAERNKPANAAQIGRRASADADLLAELLRSQGYYDAAVEPSTERAGGALRVVLTADPGA